MQHPAAWDRLDVTLSRLAAASKSAASWPMTRAARTMSPDQPQAPQKQTNTRSRPVQYSVVSPCPPSASDKAAAHPGQYRGASRRCRSASAGNQPRCTSPPACAPARATSLIPPSSRGCPAVLVRLDVQLLQRVGLRAEPGRGPVDEVDRAVRARG